MMLFSKWAVLLGAGCLAIAVAYPLTPTSSGGADTAPSRWESWAPRPELMQQTRYEDHKWHIEVVPGKTGHGGWDLHWDTVEPGRWYRVEAICQVADVADIQDQVRAEWVFWNAWSGRAGWRHVRWEPIGDGRFRYSISMQAPAASTRASLRLALRWADRGRVVWSEARMFPVAEPAPRVVKAAISTGRFPGTSIEANVQFAVQLIERAARAGADVVCLPEMITTFGGRNLPREGARPIPGPETNALCDAARRENIDVVFSMNELNGELIHNTGLYIDSEHGIVGKYRKVHLSLGETRRGLTPGDEFPIWKTRYGTVGMLICHDNFAPEPHRILSLKGAEVIFLPIMGDARAKGDPDPSRDRENWRNIMSIRAMDNHVWFLVSRNNGWGLIARPDGRIVAEADESTGFAIVEMDLNFRFRSWDASDFENRYWGERRSHLYGELETSR